MSENRPKPYLGNPQETIAVLNRYKFAFQKKFGQNFLIDTHVLERIIDEAGITPDDFVLEIGPGIGTMTQYLCESAREVAAVEIDKALIPILKDTLSPYDNVTVINEDILKIDIKKLAEEKGFDFFTTTLSISPLKNAPLLNSIGTELAEIYHVPYLVSDFKKKNGYKRSTELSKIYGLYRQDYCGCEFSQRQRK